MLLDMTIAQLAEVMILLLAGIFITLAALGIYFMSRGNAIAQHQRCHQTKRPHTNNLRRTHYQRHQDENPWA